MDGDVLTLKGGEDNITNQNIKDQTDIYKNEIINEFEVKIKQFLEFFHGAEWFGKGWIETLARYSSYNNNEKLFIEKLYKKFPNIQQTSDDYIHTFVRKILLYLHSLPKDLSFDDLIESIKYNMEYDFQKLLNKFRLKDFEINVSEKWIHPGCCNQIRISFIGPDNEKRKLTSFDCFFVYKNDNKQLIIGNIQGELKKAPRKEDGNRIPEKERKRFKHRMYGKLSKQLLSNDWGNGIIERIKELGQEENVETIGLLPPCYGLVCSLYTDYINYRFKYLNYYINNDLNITNHLQDNEFSKSFNTILKILHKFNKEDKLIIIASFRKNLSKFQNLHELNHNNYLAELFESIVQQIENTEDVGTIQEIIQNESKKFHESEKLQKLLARNK